MNVNKNDLLDCFKPSFTNNCQELLGSLNLYINQKFITCYFENIITKPGTGKIEIYLPDTFKEPVDFSITQDSIKRMFKYKRLFNQDIDYICYYQF